MVGVVNLEALFEKCLEKGEALKRVEDFVEGEEAP